MSIPITTELLDGCVLALLTQKNYYGYALTQRVQEFTPVSESTMYPVLRRLRKENWLDTYDEPYHGRNRRYYRITAAGKTRLTEIQADWSQYRDTVNQILGGTTDGN